MKELEEIKKRYKKLINEAELENKENYKFVTVEKIRYLVDEDEMNIQDLFLSNEEMLNNIKKETVDIKRKVCSIPGIREYWDFILKEFKKMKIINVRINDIVEDIVTNIFKRVNIEELYQSEGIYISYSEYLKLFEILELAYIYNCHSQVVFSTIENFISIVRYNSIYESIREKLNYLKLDGEVMNSFAAISYHICDMLSIDFTPIGKKYKQFDRIMELIRIVDGKDIMEDIK